jgi:hypothetical protein
MLAVVQRAHGVYDEVQRLVARVHARVAGLLQHIQVLP